MADLLANVATILGAGAAVVALPLAWAANRTAKRALTLALRDSAEAARPLVLYLTKASVQTQSDGGRLVEVAMLLSNPSSQPISLTRAELLIEHVGAGDSLLSLLLPQHHQGGQVHPVRLDSRDGQPTSYTFRIPAGLIAANAIRGYSVVISDAAGNTHKLEIANPTEIRPV